MKKVTYFAAITILLLSSFILHGQVNHNVSDSVSYKLAVIAINESDQSDHTINIQDDFTIRHIDSMNFDHPTVQKNITILGNGHTLTTGSSSNGCFFLALEKTKLHFGKADGTDILILQGDTNNTITHHNGIIYHRQCIYKREHCCFPCSTPK